MSIDTMLLITSNQGDNALPIGNVIISLVLEGVLSLIDEHCYPAMNSDLTYPCYFTTYV